MKKYLNQLLETPLFQNIDAADAEDLLTCLSPQAKCFAKGNYITRSGENVHAIGLVLQGVVQMLKEDVWGNRTILTVLPEQSIFGETFVCSGYYNSTVSFQAATDCTILFLSFDRILHSCGKACAFHHRLIDNMVILIAQKNIQLMEKIELTSRKSLREKILLFLSLQAQRNQGLYFTIPMSRMELAEYLGAERSALSRELSRMKDAGLIDYDRNTFRLLEKIS